MLTLSVSVAGATVEVKCISIILSIGITARGVVRPIALCSASMQRSDPPRSCFLTSFK